MLKVMERLLLDRVLPRATAKASCGPPSCHYCGWGRWQELWHTSGCQDVWGPCPSC